MNIKDFLIDNYIYIIIVVILIVITVIGFLADKKRNGAKKIKNNVPNMAPKGGNVAYQPQNVQPMTYQPVTDNNVNVSI